MKILSTTDNEFSQFGRLIDINTEEIIKEAEKIEMPESGSKYLPSVKEFEELPVMDTVQKEYFGGIPAQLGYCWGYNDMLNALEWHKCSEINIAVTDLILLLGDIRDIEEGIRYDSGKVKAFKILKGEAIEVYSTTLHFCPVQASRTGFGCVVGLLKDTNKDLDFSPDDKLLFRKNKWIIAHKDNDALLAKGIIGGIYGINHKISEE